MNQAATAMAMIKTRTKISAAAAVLVAAIAYFFSPTNTNPTTIDQVRIGATLNETTVPIVDPAVVQSSYQSLLVNNLFSRLAEYDNDGQIQAGVSTKFYWKNNSLIFEFGKKVKTASGHFINANDAAVTIRRLIKLDSTTQVNLKLFLCDIRSTEEVFKGCDAIKVENDKLILTPTNLKFKPYLLKALTSISFGIIPAQQIDKNTLAILSLKETSGPYYLEYKDSKRWILKPNDHFYVSNTAPREVILLNLEANEIWDHFIENKIDVVTTLNSVDTEVLEKIKSVPDLQISETIGIKLFFIKFSPKALIDFTPEQRLYLGERFRSIMKDRYNLPINHKPTNQFFSDVGHGHLSPEQELKISNLRQNAKPGEFRRKAKFYLYKSLEKKLSPFKEILEVEPVLTDQRAYMQKPEERLDVFTGTTDSAYEESLGLLSYNFSQGTFGLNDTQAAEWMKKYVDTEDEQKRFSMIQDLHYKTLENGITVPLFKAPYTAVARNHFKVNLSKIFASTQFWDIIKQ